MLFLLVLNFNFQWFLGIWPILWIQMKKRGWRYCFIYYLNWYITSFFGLGLRRSLRVIVCFLVATSFSGNNSWSWKSTFWNRDDEIYNSWCPGNLLSSFFLWFTLYTGGKGVSIKWQVYVHERCFLPMVSNIYRKFSLI